MVSKQPDNNPMATPSVLTGDTSGTSDATSASSVREHPIQPGPQPQPRQDAAVQPPPDFGNGFPPPPSSAPLAPDGTATNQTNPVESTFTTPMSPSIPPTPSEMGSAASPHLPPMQSTSDLTGTPAAPGGMPTPPLPPSPSSTSASSVPPQTTPVGIGSTPSPSVSPIDGAGVGSSAHTFDQLGATDALPPRDSAVPSSTPAVTPSKAELESQAHAMVKELDAEKQKLASVNADGTPPTSPPAKSKKGLKIAVVGLMGLILMSGVISGVVLVQRNQEQRGQAGFTRDAACISPKGIYVSHGVVQAGQVGGLNYKPLSSDLNNSSAYYDVSKKEVVKFGVRVKNDTNKPVSDAYHFTAQKVLEAPKGTPITEKTAYSEAQLNQIHMTQGTLQQNKYNSGSKPLTLAANEEKYIEGSFTPTECGIYQIDMGVDDLALATGKACSGDAVAAAGFIRVVGCQLSCNDPCTSDAQCEAANPDWFCRWNHNFGQWENVRSNITQGSGAVTSFSTFVNDEGNRVQHYVRGGQIWSRTRTDSWSSWENVTSNVASVGSGPITHFSGYVNGSGETTQFLVRGGKIFVRRKTASGWGNFEDQTGNVSGASQAGASGTITAFDAFYKDGQYIEQKLVQGGRIYGRNNLKGWSKWTDETGNVNGGNPVPYGVSIDSFTSEMLDNSLNQWIVWNDKLYQRSSPQTDRSCRAAANPQSGTCGLAPVPTPTTPPGVTPSVTPSVTPAPSPTPTTPPGVTPSVTPKPSPTPTTPPGVTPSATPKPSPTPTTPPGVTPSATPTQEPLACIELSKTPGAPALGDTVTFVCGGSPSGAFDYASFEYSYDGGAWETIPTLSNPPFNAKLFVDKPGLFTVRCQMCQENDGAAPTCTDWQMPETQ